MFFRIDCRASDRHYRGGGIARSGAAAFAIACALTSCSLCIRCTPILCDEADESAHVRRVCQFDLVNKKSVDGCIFGVVRYLLCSITADISSGSSFVATSMRFAVRPCDRVLRPR